MAGWRDRLGGLPAAWIAFLEEWQQKLPEGQRQRAGQLLDRLPAVPKSLRTLLDKVNERARATFNSDPAAIAIVGPVNSGKSTLINKLTGWEVAHVSPVPGTTRQTHWVKIGPFQVADTPGMNEAGGEERSRLAMETASRADLLVVLFDAGSGITESSLQIYKQVRDLDKPTLVALNKIDLVKGHESEAIRSAQEILGAEPLPLSCQTGSGLGQLMKALVLLDPRVINIMNDLLPEYQHEVARQRVATAAALAAAVGWEPLPIADIIPLTAIQGLMVLEIGKLYGQPVTPARARELVASFAGGIALREGYRQFTKLIPVAGSFLSAAYAAAGTAALGTAAIAWFESGGQMKEDDIRRLYEDALARLRALLRSRARGWRGGGDEVEQEIEEALKALPAGRPPDGSAAPPEQRGPETEHLP